MCVRVNPASTIVIQAYKEVLSCYHIKSEDMYEVILVHILYGRVTLSFTVAFAFLDFLLAEIALLFF